VVAARALVAVAEVVAGRADTYVCELSFFVVWLGNPLLSRSLLRSFLQLR